MILNRLNYRWVRRANYRWPMRPRGKSLSQVLAKARRGITYRRESTKMRISAGDRA